MKNMISMDGKNFICFGVVITLKTKTLDAKVARLLGDGSCFENIEQPLTRDGIFPTVKSEQSHPA